MEWLRQVLAGVSAVVLVSSCPSAAAAPATAERVAARAVHVEAFDVEQVGTLGVGVQLVFSVYGSPGALATLRIDGAGRELALREVDPGIYEGVYTIAAGDRIAADARVVATLARGDRLARAQLEEALVLGAPLPTVAATLAEPRAAPSAHERRPPPMVAVPLPEVAPVPSIRPVPEAATIAVRPISELPLEPMPASMIAVPVVATCENCAIVESIRVVEVPAEVGRAGAFAGGVAGAVFGERVGEAHGRRVSRLLRILSGRGASEPTATRWDVVLRLPDGRVRQRRYESPPPFGVGETIRLGAEISR